ncbi:hypothetical protein CLF_101138 [Clonorchis sinensis]|uniref:Uncharacterized protein n=1 Tax=Clonorchis sinensis TaxID=79923 RepID=G7Y530_CLOSI|nr:hypothetical protein CLF_101138 [Clonorchis sinensis]
MCNGSYSMYTGAVCTLWKHQGTVILQRHVFTIYRILHEATKSWKFTSLLDAPLGTGIHLILNHDWLLHSQPCRRRLRTGPPCGSITGPINHGLGFLTGAQLRSIRQFRRKIPTDTTTP